MKALIWIIILALVVWGVWWFVQRDNPGVPAAGDTSGQVEGASDSMGQNESGLDIDGNVEVDVKG
jgi:hypothetical protein